MLESRGIDQMVTFTVGFFAGMLLPLTLFPQWLETVARALPFASMVQLPIDIYLGTASGSEIVWTLAQQAGWCVALLGLGRVMMASATRKVVVQGG